MGIYLLVKIKGRYLQMKYMGDSEWWNKRFKTRELNVMLNEKCLEEDIKFSINMAKYWMLLVVMVEMQYI